MDKPVLFEYHTPEIGVIIFNRSEVRNAINLTIMNNFAEIVDTISQDLSLRVILVSGNGKAFSAGADIKEWAEWPTRTGGEALSSIMGKALLKFSRLHTINIALINGDAIGGGAEIALSCDLKIMADKAVIGFLHGKLGLIPGWGGGERLFRTIGFSKALELLTTARMLSSNEAHELGLINSIVEEVGLFSAGLEMAGKVCHSDPQSVHAIKKHFLQINGESREETLQREREIFIDLWETETRKELFSKALNKSN